MSGNVKTSGARGRRPSTGQASRRESALPLPESSDDAPLPTDVPKDAAEALVCFLTQHVRALMSPHADPVPSCPRCGGTQIHKKDMRHCRRGHFRPISARVRPLLQSLERHAAFRASDSTQR